ncbi:coiled-coil domain-containing protein 28A isoform X1 [Diachasmimorpha longicaudata]|uniref:coiled-coil domain-containing protein 28A isoform X1 n=1 Tax=Diachasmimorpha longicaudata TaxID=58733 RepID=UPI0030B91376
MMNEEVGCGELQQLVQEEEGEEPLSRGGEATPPSTPARSHRASKTEGNASQNSQQVLWGSNTQTSPIISKASSGQGTASQGSMVSGRAHNSSSGHGNHSRHVYLNEKEKHKPTRQDPPRRGQHRVVTAPPCRHHCFLSEVPDVRRMEQALLQLLEDFHSGNLQAFGKDCSMEQMIEIREQQEKLARLHFELGQRQDGVGSETAGLRQSSASMRHLLHKLQQLSVCIEKLHSK